MGRHSLQMLLHTYSVADWVATLLLVAVGLYLDAHPAFEKDIRPQLHDPAISYPHTPVDKQQVTSNQLWLIAGVIPLATVLCTQLIARNHVDLNQAVLGLISSLALALTLVCIVKNGIGRLRPDFLARCQPVNGVCTGNVHSVQEGRKSFPSGHSSLSFAGNGFLSLYLYGKLCGGSRHVRLWQLLICGVPLIVAVWVALSRVQDYWHHWEDVLVGCLLGSSCALGTYHLRYPIGGGVPHVLLDGAVLKGKLSPPDASDDPERSPFV